jgi:hypothetical protein
VTTRRHITSNQQLIEEVGKILIGCGLIQIGESISGGKNYYVPKVEVVDGSQKRLNIHILPGQGPDDFEAKARTIAYNLGMTEVKVIGLEPYLIQLVLVP